MKKIRSKFMRILILLGIIICLGISTFHAQASVKNQLRIKVSIPEGNHFYLKKENGYGTAFGFLGISTGLEYYLSDNYSVNSDFGAMTDFPFPFPAPLDYLGEYNRSQAIYADLQFGRDFNKIRLDLGLQGNKTFYYKYETVQLFPEYINFLKFKNEVINLGFALSASYKFTKVFHIGLNYYPSILAWDNGTRNRQYSHLMMMEIIFKINAYNPSRKHKTICTILR